MKRTIFTIICFVLTACIYAHAYDDGDFQVWNTNVEEIKLAKDAKVILEQEFRWADDARDFYYQHYDAGISYCLKKNLSVAAGYRHILSKVKGDFKVENEPYVTASLSGDFGGFSFEDRHRFEYRHFGYATDQWFYRNKATVKFPWQFTRFNIQPYIADEIFVEMDRGDFTRNRFFSGLAMDLTEHWKAEIYYMLQASKGSGSWTDVNALGVKMKISF